MSPKHAKSLPVLIYHNVNDSGAPLAMPPAVFEEHCRVLAEHGWRGVGLDEAERFLIRGAALPAKSFLITLDDGYLDNYVYAWPIMRKYGHKGVIFPVAQAVNEATATAEGTGCAKARPTLADVWSGKAKAADLPDVDAPMKDSGMGYKVRRDLFFTWHEARAMQAGGDIFFGGHTLCHESVFVGPEVKGFLQPGKVEYPFNHTIRGQYWGMPLLPYGAEVSSRAFFIEPELEAAIKRLVPQDEAGAFRFFQEEENLTGLRSLVESFKDRLGRYESELEQEERIFTLMRDNRNILASELGQPAKSFCWPWGISGEVSIRAGRAAGFEVFFNVRPGPNPAGSALRVNRFNAKAGPEKTLNRTRIYSRPILGELYRKFRM